MPNTLCLWDCENLFRTYAVQTTEIQLVNMEDIVRQVVTSCADGGLEVKADDMVHVAYADWSNPVTRQVGPQLLRLSAELRQIKSAGYNPEKNNADIALVVDALSAAFTEPWFTHFVVVSGDGGFALLAQKLKRMRKKVIGAAPEDRASRAFQYACDHFVFLKMPSPSVAQTDRPGADLSPYANVHPLRPSPRPTLGQEFDQEAERQYGQVRDKVKLTGDQDSDSATVLLALCQAAGGQPLTLPLAVIDRILKRFMPHFDHRMLGNFIKLSAYLAHVTTGAVQVREVMQRSGGALQLSIPESRTG